MFEDFVWIQTRDGSPTLWNNSLSEPFRSFKGAFTESWTVFVEPCLNHIKKHPRNPIMVGEFGLGVGTNWWLMGLALRSLGVEFQYFAIERDVRSFEMGLESWPQQQTFVKNFLSERGVEVRSDSLVAGDLARPMIFASVEEAQHAGLKADYWFHDPFGFAVNPEGYELPVMRLCHNLWKPSVFGVSYACNKHFKDTLNELGRFEVRVVDLQDHSLKRSRLEFSE